MISKHYELEYRTFFKETLCNGRYKDITDESALPSYTHPNPLMSWLFWERVRVALAMAGPNAGKVLDFGCGAGVTFRHFSALGCEITGCDDAAQELAAAASHAMGVDARIIGNLREIEGESFDVILALDVLEHIQDLDGITSELKTFFHRQTVLVLSGPTENFLYKLGRKLAGFSGHYHVHNIYDIEKHLAANGLVRMSHSTLYPIAPLFRLSSWRLKNE